MNILNELRRRFGRSIEELDVDHAAAVQMVQPAQDARFGDYQINAAMSLAKRWKRPPREVAAELLDRLELEPICDVPEIAGPGFINLRLRDDWIADRIVELAADPRLGVSPTSDPETYVIDYSSPNVAKPMHVGHIRSTVIGDALYRILGFLGHRTISDNHLGDWGTQFGMILYGFKHFRDDERFRTDPVAELARLYQVVNRLIDYEKKRSSLPQWETRLGDLRAALENADAEGGDDKKARKRRRRLQQEIEQLAGTIEQAQATITRVESDRQLASLLDHACQLESAVLTETAKLHEGDEENRRLWEQFMPHCKQALSRVYQRLGVRFDYEYGESFYHDALDALVQKLLDDGLAEESEGAICIFFDDFETPMIVRKRDGAFLYATTDLATIAFRMKTWQPDAILYVVDHRQSEHFSKLFAAARKIGYTDVRLVHVAFGTVLGEDGRPFKTRSGDVVGLESLLDEAVERAYQVVSANDDAKRDGAELDERERRHIAEVVGIGAIKYADLSHHRTSDYVFSYDQMLALEGNTATYLQYSYARIRSIFAKGDFDPESAAQVDPWQWEAPIERELALQLLRLPEALQDVEADYTPHQLTGYLYELANRFHKFYQQCPVLRAETDRLRRSRLLLCELVARTIRTGLQLLGIDVVERM